MNHNSRFIHYMKKGQQVLGVTRARLIARKLVLLPSIIPPPTSPLHIRRASDFNTQKTTHLWMSKRPQISITQNSIRLQKTERPQISKTQKRIQSEASQISITQKRIQSEVSQMSITQKIIQSEVSQISITQKRIQSELSQISKTQKSIRLWASEGSQIRKPRRVSGKERDAIMRGKWMKVEQKEGGPKGRSSHAVAVVGNNAYVFGGEFEPRVPVDNAMHVLNLENNSWSVAEAKGAPPPPRVGVTMVAIGPMLYIFGGRDQLHKELNEFYTFDTLSGEWTLISSETASPPHRSYHAMSADGKQVYVFGGCGKDGRLNDLWAFNVDQGEWRCFPAPPPGSNLVPRGGPGLAVVGNKVWVVFGFGGKHELSDVHFFDLDTQSWNEVETRGEKPTARSVFACFVDEKYIVVSGGEVDPSDLGHMGAGAFVSDVFALDTQSLEWKKVNDEVEGKAHPGPRGWTAFSPGFCCGSSGMVVYGGNSPSNKRLEDIFFLELQLD